MYIVNRLLHLKKLLVVHSGTLFNITIQDHMLYLMKLSTKIKRYEYYSLLYIVETIRTYIRICMYIVGARLSEPQTGNSRFHHSVMVTFPKVYAMNTESPTLSVVVSTMV